MTDGDDRGALLRQLEEAVAALAKAVEKRKEVEEELREREELLKTLFENSPIGIYRTTPDGKVLMVNPALLRMLNYESIEQATSRNLEREILERGLDTDYFTPEYDRAYFKELIERDGFVSGLESKWKRRDGKFIWVRENAKVVKGPDGRIRYYEGTIEDITEKRLVEEELRKSRERLKAIYENTPVGIYTTTPDGRILSANPALVRMLGFSSFEELAKRNLDEPGFEPTYDRQQFKERMARDGQITGLEFIWERRDGSRMWIRESARVVQDETGQTVYEGAIENITERKAMEEELRISQELLRTIFDNSPIGIFRTAPDGTILTTNPALLRMAGVSSQEEIPRFVTSGEILRAVYNREDVLRKVATDGVVSGLEIPWSKPDGSTIWLRMNIKAFVGRDGTLQHFDGTIEDITEKRLAEEAVREAKDEWERTFDTVPEFILILDGEMRIIQANGAFLSALDASMQDVKGRRVHEVLHGEPSPKEGCPHADLPTGPAEKSSEVWVERLGMFLHVTTTPLKGPDGSERGVVFVARDITARKRMEDEIRATNERFMSLVANIPGVVYRAEVNPPWRMLYISSDILALSGYSVTDFDEGRIVYGAIVHPDDLEDINREIQAARIRNEAYELVYRIVRKDGQVRWVFEKGRGVRDEKGNVWLDGVIIDITERNKAEEALKSELMLNIALTRISNMILREQVDPIDVAELVLEHARRITHSEHGFVSAIEDLNRDAGENPMKILALALPSAPDAEALRAMSEAFISNSPGKDPRIGRSAFGGAEGQNMLYVPVVLSDNLVGQVCLADSRRGFTGDDLESVFMLAEIFAIGLQRKRLESQVKQYTSSLEAIVASKTRELEASNERLRRIDAMRTEFIDVAAHELRTPLSSIKLYLDLMRMGQIGSFAPEDREVLEDISKALGNLNSLISAMLDYTRTGTQEMHVSEAPVDLSRIAEDVVQEFSPLAAVRGIVATWHSSGDPRAQVDPDLVRRAIVNLVSNAVKYTDAGGRVRVSVDGTGRDIVVSVADTGIGIPEEKRANMFERFYVVDTSLTRERDSLGLGLPIVKSIVERHGGSVWVESQLGKGSTFRFSVPRRPSMPAQV